MPEGIIRDPKQNPKEENFGIVFCNDEHYHQYNGKNYKYSKGAQTYNRLYMAGEAIIFDEHVRVFTPEQEFEGIKISGEVTILCYNPVESQRAPVIQQLTRPHSPNARAAAINHAIDRGMQSPFGKIDMPAPNPPNCPQNVNK